MKNRWDIIDRLGASLGASKNARRMWRYRGVSRNYQAAIIMAARKEGIEIRLKDFEAVR